MVVNFAEEELEAGLTMMVLSGTLDAPGAMGIEQQFQKRIQDHSGNVIIELSGLDYMSSYGLRMILTAAKALHDKGGGLHLAAPNSHVMEVIRVAGYDTMFPVYETLNDAIVHLTR
jgi:anti-anti-sigma factor